MWLANFENGESMSSKKNFWTQIPKEKKMTGLQLSHPHLPKLFLCLADLDRYYFTQEAMAFLGSSSPTITAEIIGGHDLKLGVGIEVRLAHTGSVSIKTYPVDRFKYSPEILVEGNRNGSKSPRPGVLQSLSIHTEAPAES